MERQRQRCHCGGTLRRLDGSKNSETLACPECQHCYLCLNHPSIQELIPLRDFHVKRGDGPSKRPLNDLAMAKNLYDCLLLDMWPSPATMSDFGIDTSDHLGALQSAVRAGISAYELDRVMGDGPAITRLIRCVPNQPYEFVRFETVYDSFSWENEEEEVA